MTEPVYVYNPLERRTYEAIAYNAIGRASEVGTYPAYGLVHSTGNSGWSVGVVQWDFGQPSRGHKVEPMLDGYQAWAQPSQRFTEQEIESLSTRLQTRGQVGNALTADEQSRMNAYLRSDSGREFVDSLNREQIDRKWTNVGEPLSEIPWLQRLSARDPQEAAEIVTLTSKLFNQNENRGGQLLRHLQQQQQEMTADQTYAWIGDQGVRGLNTAATAAILSGRDAALSGVRLMNQLETGDGQLSRLWREQVHANGNVGMTQGFNTNPSVQLFDAMMRNPAAGERIVATIDEQAAARPVVIQGINALAREEISRTELNRQGELTVRGPDGTDRQLTANGWTYQQIDPPPRQIDQQDYMVPGRYPMPPREEPQGTIDHDAPAPARDNPQPAAILLDSPAHPNHAMYSALLKVVHERDRELGRTPDSLSSQLAGGLTEQALARGLTSIGSAKFFEDGRLVGMTDTVNPSAEWARTAVGNVGELVGKPLVKSSEGVGQLNQQIQLSQAQNLTQNAPTQDDPSPRGPRV
ncbi:MAG: hypothetical protein JNM58_07620 [Xanthomonadaceae bacterium]|nr:hypothetical protein [Xanthomonadaceae bacterium]